MPISKLRPSFTLTEDRLRELQAVIPEAFADGRINWDTLKEALGETLEDEDKEHFGLFWPGKREARRLAALPSKGTLIPQPGAGVDEDSTHNLFIEGDNLEVLKLLQKSYAGRVKMIYIDPPYNTGNDFVYSDDYSEPLEAYLHRTGQADEMGQLLTTNSRASGRFHSNWLNMIYPRLVLARLLLKEDGLIFVSIDDNEMHHLKQIMNEIFGEEQFLATLVWKRRTGSNDAKNFVSSDHEYIFLYAKSDLSNLKGVTKDFSNYSNPDNDPRGDWARDNLTCNKTAKERPNLYYPITDPVTGITYQANPNRVWAYERGRMERLISEGKVLFPAEGKGTPTYKRHLSEVRSDRKPFSSWIETSSNNGNLDDSDVRIIQVPINAQGTKDLRNIFEDSGFNYPKSPKLIVELLKQATSTDEEDIVMDFFSGSGTTAQAVLELNREDGGNRRFILVQIQEPSNNPKYPTISEIGRERIRRFSKLAKKEKSKKLNMAPNEDLGFMPYKLDKSNFSEWESFTGKDTSQLELRFGQAETPLIEGWTPENLLAEILLLQGFPLDSRVASLPEFKANTVQQVTSEFVGHHLYICLDKKIKAETVAKLSLRAEDILVCLDSALSDEAKVNLADRCNLKVI